MKVLHFSHFNTVNVPLTYAELYRSRGHESRLLTLYKHRGGIPEDICLNKKVFNPFWLKKRRSKRERDSEDKIVSSVKSKKTFEFKAGNIFERMFFQMRDAKRGSEFNKILKKYLLNEFDVYCFHGGVGYFRDSRWIKSLAKKGKHIICHYHGPDLRTRGIIKDIDSVSCLNTTNEFDLLDFHNNLHYIPIPYDCSSIPQKNVTIGGKLHIIHTPSNPAAKGTHLIEPVLKRIAKERNVVYDILTGVSREDVLCAKKQSDIAIEQVGNFGGTGYGVNSLETLAMNIPTVTEFTPEYSEFLKNHPFVLADSNTLYDTLIKLIDNEKYRRDCAKSGRRWVEEHHGFNNVWNILSSLIKKHVPELSAFLNSSDF